MNYLVALLAFSAVMIVLATLATVVVETIHKIVGQRPKDFKVMLTQLYTDVVVPRINREISDKGERVAESLDDFIKKMVSNPAIKETGWVSKIPFSNLSTEFEEMTTRQFVEQFRNTQAGEKLKQQSEDKIKMVMHDIAYEFERYGEAAKMFFQRRATFLAILTSLLLSITLNIDAISLFDALARDKSLSEKVVEAINVEKLEQTYTDRINHAESDKQIESISEQMAAVRKSIRDDAARLEGLGLPVGHQYYPYCATSQISDDGSISEHQDPRCENAVVIKKVEYFKAEYLQIFNIPLTWIKGFIAGLAMVLFTETGLTWLFRAILTGALIGLGAPFWFKTYQFLAQFVPGRKQPAADSTQARQSYGDKTSRQPVTVVIHNAAADDKTAAREDAERAESKASGSTGPARNAAVIAQAVPQVQKVQGLTPNDMLNIIRTDTAQASGTD